MNLSTVATHTQAGASIIHKKTMLNPFSYDSLLVPASHCLTPASPEMSHLGAHEALAEWVGTSR